MNKTSKGALCLIGSSTAFALMGIFVKLSGGAVSLMQQVFARNIVMLLFSGLMIKKNKERFLPLKENRIILLLRCLFGFLALVGNFYAVNNLYLGDAQALQKISPFFVTILAVLFLGEKLTKLKVVSLVMAFIGALLVVNPKFDPRLMPALIGLLASFLAAIAYTILSYLQRKENQESGNTIIFNFALVSCILSLVPMVKNLVIPDLKLGILLFLIGAFASLGQFLITKAYSLTEASLISIFDYSGVVVSSILGLLIFQEHLPLTSILGIGIIILSGYMTYRNNIT